jgi:hypothetical protein
MTNHDSSDDGEKNVIFETFETSATCEQVLAAGNALQWDFPGQAVAIPHDTLLEEDFQHSLCTFLEQASIESQQVSLCATADVHLENRAISRNGLRIDGHNSIYRARDRSADMVERSDVADMAKLLLRWPSQIQNTSQLASLLEGSQVIGGYVRYYDKIQITDISKQTLMKTGERW